MGGGGGLVRGGEGIVLRVMRSMGEGEGLLVSSSLRDGAFWLRLFRELFCWVSGTCGRDEEVWVMGSSVSSSSSVPSYSEPLSWLIGVYFGLRYPAIRVLIPSSGPSTSLSSSVESAHSWDGIGLYLGLKNFRISLVGSSGLILKRLLRVVPAVVSRDCLLSGGDDMELVGFVGFTDDLIIVADCKVEGDRVGARGADLEGVDLFRLPDRACGK